jgi:hypothetical protein
LGRNEWNWEKGKRENWKYFGGLGMWIIWMDNGSHIADREMDSQQGRKWNETKAPGETNPT